MVVAHGFFVFFVDACDILKKDSVAGQENKFTEFQQHMAVFPPEAIYTCKNQQHKNFQPLTLKTIQQ